MKVRSIRINTLLNIIKTLVVLAFPLITYPYVFRILGVEQMGIYSFTKSIVNYFALIASLGITNYAIREGARIRDDRKKFEEFSSQMFSINLISTFIAYTLLGLGILLWEKLSAYSVLIAIQSLVIICTTLGMDWLNSCLEDYAYITLRTIMVQIISIATLFFVVHDRNDLVPYTIVLLLSNTGGNIANIFYIRKHVRVRFNLRGVKRHLKPIFLLFASAVATIIYVNSDTTMLGVMSGEYYVGLYTASSKVYSVIQQVLSAAILVTMPRLSNLYANARMEEFKTIVSDTFNMAIVIGFPSVIGLFVLADKIILLFAGEEFLASIPSFRILCFSLGFSLFGIFFTNALLLPLKKEKIFSIILIIAATINFLLNLVLVPFWRQNGAAFTTMIAELFVMGAQYICVRKLGYIHVDFHCLVGTFIGCAWIVFVSFLFSRMIDNAVLFVAVVMGISIIGYFVIQFLSGNRYIKEMIMTVLSKIMGTRRKN